MSKRHALNHAQAQMLWNPQQDETVLWQGKPDALVLARTAFRARIVAGYFLALTALALVFGGGTGAIFMLLAGLATLAILHGLAYLSARTTTYLLTDRRVILHIGMAIEKTINLPLRQIGAAHLSEKGGGYGEIALEPAAEHTLGYALLWPHARPWRYARPQPMLRAVPAAASVAEKLAGAVAAHQPIERSAVPGKTPQPARPRGGDAPVEGALA